MTGAVVRIEEADVVSPEACAALRAYLAEISERFNLTFDIDRAIAMMPGILSPPAGVFFLVRRDAGVVGCGGLTFLGHGRAEVRRMWIDPSARGLGLGRTLLGHLENVARQQGCTEVVLDTHSSLTEALALYRTSGYQPIAPYNDNKEAAFWFRKPLGDA
jgi:ribosomal protein S18 acetylase RimI-like enzyme